MGWQAGERDCCGYYFGCVSCSAKAGETVPAWGDEGSRRGEVALKNSLKLLKQGGPLVEVPFVIVFGKHNQETTPGMGNSELARTLERIPN